MKPIEAVVTGCPKECGRSFCSPFTTCDRCQPAERRAEMQRMLSLAENARPVAVDGYGFGLVAWMGDDRFVRVGDAMQFLRMEEHRSREDLVGDAQRLRNENRELLVENATLRRALEKRK